MGNKINNIKEENHELKQGTEEIVWKVKELKTYTSKRIKETKVEIKIEMIFRITKVKTLQEDKVNKAKEIQEEIYKIRN